MARALAAAGALAFFATAPSGATDAPVAVNVEFQDFRPTPLDVLPGEAVQWTNISDRRHTVTADDGSFDSGDLFNGNQFAHTFDTVGAFQYHCRVHAGMVGEVDVRRVILDVLPTAPVPAGQRVDFTGRAADPSHPVTIEEDTGDGFRAVAQATPAPDGSWSTPVVAARTGDFRATSGADASESRRMIVLDRHVKVRATRRGLIATVTPSDPYARVRLQVWLRERFGWWPTTLTRLDYVSQVEFAVKRPAKVRVVLVDRDGWTPVATSAVLHLR